VDCDISKTLEVLRQAEQIGMTRWDYSYILTTLDLQPSDMDEYKYGDAQFFAFRLVDLERSEVEGINRELSSIAGSGSSRSGGPYRQQEFPIHNSIPRGLTVSQPP